MPTIRSALADQRGVARDVEAAGDLAVESRPVELRRLVVGRVAAAQRRGHLVALPVGAREQLRRHRDERRRRARPACAPDWCRSRRSPRPRAAPGTRRRARRAARTRLPRRRCAGAAASRRRSSAAWCSRCRRCRRPACRRECAPADCAARRRRAASRATWLRGLAAAAESVVVGRAHRRAGRGRAQAVAVGLVPGAVSGAARACPSAAPDSPACADRAAGPAAARIGRDEAGAAGAGARRIAEARQLARFRIVEIRQRARRARIGRRGARGRVCARWLRSLSSSAGRKPLHGRVAGCANACVAASAAMQRTGRHHEDLKPRHAARATSSRPREARLMVNGCKTRMVNVALSGGVRLARPFPC